MHALCSNKLNFIIQHPIVCSNKFSINERLEIFHKARNVDEVRHWKKLHTSMKNMKMITIGFSTLLRYVKKLKNDDSIESVKIKSDKRFVLRPGKKWKTVSEETSLMNERSHC